MERISGRQVAAWPRDMVTLNEIHTGFLQQAEDIGILDEFSDGAFTE